MTLTDTSVLVAGAAAIAAINWYYFFATRSAATAAASGGLQTVEIVVRGGYDPGTVRAKRGVPLRLVFNRQEDASCSEEVVIPALRVRRFLAPFAKTAVDVTPTESGKFDITCGMSMLHGSLVVDD